MFPLKCRGGFEADALCTQLSFGAGGELMDGTDWLEHAGTVKCQGCASRHERTVLSKVKVPRGRRGYGR